jgi:hypothetical protein
LKHTTTPSTYSSNISVSSSSSSSTTVIDTEDAFSQISQMRSNNVFETRKNITASNMTIHVGSFSYVGPVVANIPSAPIWHQPFFLDLFADCYVNKLVPSAHSSAHQSSILRMHIALDAIHNAMRVVNYIEIEDEPIRESFKSIKGIFYEAFSFCNLIPQRDNNGDRGDSTQTLSYIVTLLLRLKSLNVGDSAIIPCSWPYGDGWTDSEKKSNPDKLGKEHAILLVVTKYRDNTDSNYYFAVINTGDDASRGLNRHAVSVDLTDGSILRNVSFQLTAIPNHKILNSAFWLLIFNSTITPNTKFGCQYFYEKLIPYLTSMPILSAIQLGIYLNLYIYWSIYMSLYQSITNAILKYRYGITNWF